MLSPEEKEKFEKAKQSEVNNWLQTGTVTKVMRNQFSRANLAMSVDPCVETNREPTRSTKTRKDPEGQVKIGSPRIHGSPA